MVCDRDVCVGIISMWLDPADDNGNITWTCEFGARMKPYTTGCAYLNFIGEEGEDRVLAAFGPETYARLQALNDRYDQTNPFRLNQNIKPTGHVSDLELAAARA